MGEELAGLEKRHGGHAAKARSHDVTEQTIPPKLKELGVEKMQSSRWQGVYRLTALRLWQLFARCQ